MNSNVCPENHGFIHLPEELRVHFAWSTSNLYDSPCVTNKYYICAGASFPLKEQYCIINILCEIKIFVQVCCRGKIFIFYAQEVKIGDNGTLTECQGGVGKTHLRCILTVDILGISRIRFAPDYLP